MKLFQQISIFVFILSLISFAGISSEEIYSRISAVEPNKPMLEVPYEKDSFSVVQHPFCRQILRAETLLSVRSNSVISVFRLVEGKIEKQINLEIFSVQLGGEELFFEEERHHWQGQSMQTRFASTSQEVYGRWRIIRDVCLDDEGRFFIEINIYASNKLAKENAKSKEIKIAYRMSDYASRNWEIFCRNPDLKIHEIDKRNPATFTLNNGKGKFYLAGYCKSSTSDKEKLLTEKIAFKNILGKRNPLSSIKSARKRWINRAFPGWDCPEPWLNKLWHGQVVAIQSSILSDKKTRYLKLRDDRYLFDACWLRDRRIGFGTLLSVLGEKSYSPFLVPAGRTLLCCSPEPKVEKMLKRYSRRYRKKCSVPSESQITSYGNFIKWCQNFYVNYDYRWICDVALNRSEDGLDINFPSGVINFVVTKIVGLTPANNDNLVIEPARWIKRWPYFAIDNLPYRAHYLTIIWQKKSHYKRYADKDYGLSLYLDGKLVKKLDKLGKIKCELK